MEDIVLAYFRHVVGVMGLALGDLSTTGVVQDRHVGLSIKNQKFECEWLQMMPLSNMASIGQVVLCYNAVLMYLQKGVLM